MVGKFWTLKITIPTPIYRNTKENSHFQELRRGGTGSFCFIGTEFQLGEMREFWSWTALTGAQHCALTAAGRDGRQVHFSTVSNNNNSETGHSWTKPARKFAPLWDILCVFPVVYVNNSLLWIFCYLNHEAH